MAARLFNAFIILPVAVALIETYIVLLYQVSRIKSQKNYAFQEVKTYSFLLNAAAKVQNILTPATFFSDF